MNGDSYNLEEINVFLLIYEIILKIRHDDFLKDYDIYSNRIIRKLSKYKDMNIEGIPSMFISYLSMSVNSVNGLETKTQSYINDGTMIIHISYNSKISLLEFQFNRIKISFILSNWKYIITHNNATIENSIDDDIDIMYLTLENESTSKIKISREILEVLRNATKCFDQTSN